MEPGTCENGTIYSHLNVWMMLGLLRYGMADRALDLFHANVTGDLSDEEDLKRNVSPFMVSNCYFGPDHRNNAFQMEFTWITGSLAWFNIVMLRDMLGVQPEYGGLRISPCLPSTWTEVSVEREYRGATYTIRFHNPNKTRSNAISLSVDGQLLQGDLIPAFKDGKKHQVEVTFRPA